MKIKVLHITTVSGIGGAERMVLDLVAKVDRNRFEMSVASLHGKGLLADRVRDMGVPFIDLGFGNPFRFLKSLRMCLQTGRYDIVQLHGDTAEVVVRPLARWFGADALISMVHGLWSFASLKRNLLLRLCKGQIDRFVSVSEVGKKLLQTKRDVPEKRITVIYPGISAPDGGDASVRELLRAQLGVSEDALLVLTVANLRAMKGHFAILEAAAILRQQTGKIVFVFVGQDNSEGEVERQAGRLGVLDQVRFLGYQSRVFDYLRAADVFLLPSESEGLPVSILEAMAVGLPVIATRVGGIPEIITDGENGVLVDPRQPGALAHALSMLSADSQRRKSLGDAGRRRVEKTFSMAGMVRHYEELYQELYDEKHRTY